MTTNDWQSETYAKNAAFVPALAADLVDLLAPKRGERILDLGCGDGVLTEKIVAAGAVVVGVDLSASMVEAARARGIDAHIGDAERLTFDNAFDAVFSNAVLHWTRDIDAVLAGVSRALRTSGRFVGELGAHGNVASIIAASARALERRGLSPGNPWYFPTAVEFTSALKRHHFTIDQITTFERPTVLPTGVPGWMETFGGPLIRAVDSRDRPVVVREIEEDLAATNRDRDGQWMADYVRLRFVATIKT